MTPSHESPKATLWARQMICELRNGSLPTARAGFDSEAKIQYPLETWTQALAVPGHDRTIKTIVAAYDKVHDLDPAVAAPLSTIAEATGASPRARVSVGRDAAASFLLRLGVLADRLNLKFSVSEWRALMARGVSEMFRLTSGGVVPYLPAIRAVLYGVRSEPLVPNTACETYRLDELFSGPARPGRASIMVAQRGPYQPDLVFSLEDDHLRVCEQPMRTRAKSELVAVVVTTNGSFESFGTFIRQGAFSVERPPGEIRSAILRAFHRGC